MNKIVLLVVLYFFLGVSFFVPHYTNTLSPKSIYSLVDRVKYQDYPGTYGKVVYDKTKPTILFPVSLHHDENLSYLGDLGELVMVYRSLKNQMPDYNVLLYISTKTENLEKDSFYGVDLLAGNDVAIINQDFYNEMNVRESLSGIVRHNFFKSISALPPKIKDGDVPTYFISEYTKTSGEDYSVHPNKMNMLNLSLDGKWILPHNFLQIADETLANVEESKKQLLDLFLDAYPLLDRDSLEKKTFGVSYARNISSLTNYLNVLSLAIANYDGYPEGISLFHIPRPGEYLAQQYKLKKELADINSILKMTKGAERILVANEMEEGYLYYYQNMYGEIKTKKVTHSKKKDICLIVSNPIPQDMLTSAHIVAASEKGDWWVPSLMTGIGSYINAACTHVYLGFPVLHDALIFHLSIDPKGVAESFVLDKYVNNSAQAFSMRLHAVDNYLSEDLIEVLRSSSFKEGQNIEDYRRFFREKDVSELLAQKIRSDFLEKNIVLLMQKSA